MTNKITLIICSFFYLTLNAQIFVPKKEICKSCCKKLYLSIPTTSFVKNNEYFDKFTEGFTGIGWFSQPTLNYTISEKTSLTIGSHILKYHGDKGLNEILPIFSVQQKLHKNLDLIFGSLNGSLNHQLDEPLFRFDRFYQDNTEYGLQFWYNTNKTTAELWIDWEKYIFKDSPFQEAFTLGFRGSFNILRNDSISINIPLQNLFFHRGGQINNFDVGISTILNNSTGVDLNYIINEQQQLSFSPKLLIYKGLAMPDHGINSQPFKNGIANYSKITYTYSNYKLQLGYWNAKNFIAPKGEFLFQSISEHLPNYTKTNRSLLTGKLKTSFNFGSSVKLHFNIDTYFDTHNKELSHAAGLYLIIDENFFLLENTSQLNDTATNKF